jgi:hypothetical protein
MFPPTIAAICICGHMYENISGLYILKNQFYNNDKYKET